jgi:putative DNA primase/helicase
VNTIPKPVPPRVVPENIPAEMKARNQWVVWKYEWKAPKKKKPGKWDKPPINARTGGYASSTDAETWCSFEVAWSAYSDPANGYDGIGYVFSGDDDDFVGVDLDHCRDPHSEQILAWTQEQRKCEHWAKEAPDPQQIIESLPTYVEVSPSRKGVKLFVKAKIVKAIKHGSVEMYSRGRYFTVTGHKLEKSPSEITDCNQALDAIYPKFNSKGEAKRKPRASEVNGRTTTAPSPPTNAVIPNIEQVIAGCENARNGDKFRRLFGGDTSGYPSQSEADLALCGIVAYWSAGQASLIDAAFRRSKLFRDKWDESRGDQTYGQRTIAAALDGCTGYYDWSQKRETARDKKESDRSSDGGIIKRLADKICESNHFAQDLGGKLYRFSSGVYKAKGEEYVRRKVKKVLNDWKLTKLWSPSLADSVVEYVRVDSPLLWETPPLDVINVKNGLLNVLTREIRPHSPDHLSSIQLPVRYDPAATCPAIEQFVSQVFPADATDLAWEIPALLMTPDTSIQQAVLLYGIGGNGKSTYLALARAFLGKTNSSALSLHKLESDRFAVARLCGKLANICPDLPSEHLAGTSVFKALTGGDEVTGEYKFKDSFEFTPFARLVFSANSLPQSKDSSQGFFERWLVIPFERSFRGQQEEIPRKELDAALSAKCELSGLLNKALDALDRIRGQNGFTQPQSVRRAWQEFHAITDPLAVWLDRFTVEAPRAFVIRGALRVAFNQSLEAQGRPPITDTAFGKAFEKLRPGIESKQRTVNRKLEWCYVGIGLRSDQPAGSHTSQGSQGSSPMFQSHARGDSEGGKGESEVGEIAGEQVCEIPVNPVNPVNPEDHPSDAEGVLPLPVNSDEEGTTSWKV